MSGYFSGIARQGGARIAGDAGQRAGTPTSKTESHLSRIDHEETVMVPLRESSDVPASKPAKADVDTAVQDKTRGQKTAERSTSAIDAAIKSSLADAKRPITLDVVREEVRLIERKAARGFSHVTVSPSPTPAERKTETLEPIAIDESAKRIMADPRTAEGPAKKSTEKRFFEKTAEIVEGQTAQSAELYTILLREVQEWIAAGQPAPDEVSADVADPAAESLADSSRPSEREPGVVRIVENRLSKLAAREVKEVSTTDFSEHNFELSIGSISVVVEDDERPPAPAPAQIAAQPALRETPLRTSRLSRHYL